MADPNKIPNHIRWMGTLVVNLQSLEFALRAFLRNCETGWTKQGGLDFFDSIAEGQQVEKNAFTNYDQLGTLIDKYNKEVQPTYPDLEVDRGITRIRDALAHGRIASRSPLADVPEKLVKYDRPKNGLVCVTDCYALTKEWFDNKNKWVYENLQKVCKANNLFGGTNALV